MSAKRFFCVSLLMAGAAILCPSQDGFAQVTRPGNEAKPLVLYDFDKDDTVKGDITPNGGTKLELTSEHAAAGKALKIIFPDKGEYSGIRVQPSQQDWSAYEFLAIDVFNPTDRKIPMTFEACDRKSGIDKEHAFGFYNTRFGDWACLEPGHNTLAFRVSPAWTWNEARLADSAHMRVFAIWADNPPPGLVLTADNIRLATKAALAEKPRLWFDFAEDKPPQWADLKCDGDTATSPPVLGSKDFPVRFQVVAENATWSKRSLKLTFSGGRFPTVTTDKLPEVDLTPYRTFMADLIVDKPCVVIFRIVFEHKADAKRTELPRWEKAALCRPGRNTVVEDFQVDAKQGKAIAFEIGLYNADKDEVIYVDGVRFLKTSPGEVTPFRGRNVVRSG